VTDRSNLTRVVESISSVPRGVTGANLLAAILEGIRQGPDPYGVLADALAAAYVKAAGDPSRRVHASAPVRLNASDPVLLQVEHETRKALDLGATPRAVLDRVANGLTGCINGPVEDAAGRAMTEAYEHVVDTVPQPYRPVIGREVFRTWACKGGNHISCRRGWRAPSGWMPCTCTCHRTLTPKGDA
jgi:hypothetical protein